MFAHTTALQSRLLTLGVQPRVFRWGEGVSPLTAYIGKGYPEIGALLKETFTQSDHFYPHFMYNFQKSLVLADTEALGVPPVMSVSSPLTG